MPPEFMDPAGRYFVEAYRARVIFYSKARVKPSELSTYEDLADPKWKGRICVRSGSHDYNLALFGQFFASYGEAKAKSVISGIADNLARAPKGGDRDQARAHLRRQVRRRADEHLLPPADGRQPGAEALGRGDRRVLPQPGRKRARSSCGRRRA